MKHIVYTTSLLIILTSCTYPDPNNCKRWETVKTVHQCDYNVITRHSDCMAITDDGTVLHDSDPYTVDERVCTQ
jgi:hypothetical protein